MLASPIIITCHVLTYYQGKKKAAVLEDVVMPDPTPRRKTRLSIAQAARSPVTPDDMQLNKARKKEFKKMKKQRKRAGEPLITNTNPYFVKNTAGRSTGANNICQDVRDTIEFQLPAETWLHTISIL